MPVAPLYMHLKHALEVNTHASPVLVEADAVKPSGAFSTVCHYPLYSMNHHNRHRAHCWTIHLGVMTPMGCDPTLGNFQLTIIILSTAT